MTTEIMKRKSFAFVFGIALVLLSGCGASFQVAGDIAQGRQALLKGDNQSALTYFRSATQIDPNYVWGSELREGVCSYLGRAQYLTGDVAQARQTLERCVARNKADNLARLYLGLALARQNDRDRARREIENGMRGIRDFLNYLNTSFAFSFGQYWDPSREIRKAIDSDLAMISGGKFGWPALIAEGERLGKKVEEEPDLALQRQQDQEQMDQLR